MKIRRLLVSSFVAITAVLGTGYGAFEYWLNLQASALPEAVTQAKLTEMKAADVEQIGHLATLLAQSPLPWHQQQAQRFNDLLEVADAAQRTFSSKRVEQLRVGQLLTLQQEMEDYVRRYPRQAYTPELKQELPAIRSMVTFFPIIKHSAGERSVDSALRASRRGATLAALVIRKLPAAVIADSSPAAPAVPVALWSKAENDVLYDYSQALKTAEQGRLRDDDRLKIGRQVCAWLNDGQGYWGVRSLFDGQYKTQIAGDYSHNRDVYIRFGTERLCPQYTASLVAPAEAAVQIAKTPAPNRTSNNWATTNPRWTVEAQSPQYLPAPYSSNPQLIPPGMLPPGSGQFPNGIR